jgi:tRNA G46 methylase TrmB
LLKPGGLFIMSTDVDPLAHWMFKHSNAHDQFEWTGLSGDDWTMQPSDWPIDQTRYMKKGLAGNVIYWLIFKRK